MLLRLIVLVLTVANLAYFAWTEGWLDGMAGPKSIGEREPARADAQVRPEVMVVSEGRGTITAGLAASSKASPPSAPPSSAGPAAASGAASAPGTAPSPGASSGASGPAPATAASSGASAVAPSPAASVRATPPPGPNAATGTLSAPTAAMSSSPSSPTSHVAASAAPAPLSASANSPAASGSFAASAAGPSGPAVCLQSGPYAAKDAGAAEAAFKTVLPAGSWTRVAIDKPGVWMIYMGRFADNDARRKKEGELSRRNATYEEIEAPAEFAKGLSLGRFPSRADAEKGLAELNKQGVHTARIVTFQAPVQASLLRVDQADPATADKLRALRTPMPVVACQP